MKITKVSMRVLFSLVLVITLNISVVNGWWNNDWNKCKNMTFNSSKVDTNLTNFETVLFLNTSTINYSLTNDDGSDIRIVNDNCTGVGTVVDYEIDIWNETGTSNIWFKANISSNTDTIYSIYYNNSDASDAQDLDNLWSNEYEAVLHDAKNDVSGNNNTFVGGGDPTNRYTCKIGNCTYFDGDDHIDHPTLWDIAPNNMTVCFWFNFDNTFDSSSPTSIFLMNKHSGTERIRIKPNGGSDGEIRYELAENGNSFGFSSDTRSWTGGNYYSICGIWGTTKGAEFWVNGIRETNDSSKTTLFNNFSDNDLAFAASDTGVAPMTGELDEIWLLDYEATDTWIKVKYEAETNNLISLDFEEIAPNITTTTTTPTTTTTTILSFNKIGNYTGYFCSGKYLVKNITTQTGNSTDNSTTEVFEYTECEYNCSTYLNRAYCNYSPFITWIIFIVLLLGGIILLKKVFRI